MLSRRSTYEELMKESMTHRLKILPERQKRTQQGLLIEQVDFNDFDLSRYDKYNILNNDENPEKGVQTSIFSNSSSSSSVETPVKTPNEEIKEEKE